MSTDTIERRLIAGAGGGKGGGSGRVAVEAPDSLRSKQYATVLDLVSEGEIGGLVDGLKSIYLDGTPIMAADGSLNFKDVGYFSTKGAQTIPDGRYFSNGSVSSAQPINVEVLQVQPVVRTVTNPEADWADVTIGIPGLTQQDMSTGDVNGASVQFSLDVQSDGGGFQALPLGWAWTGGEIAQSGLGFTTGPDTTSVRFRLTSYHPQGDLANSGYTVSVQYRPLGESAWRTAETREVRAEWVYWIVNDNDGYSWGFPPVADFSIGGLAPNRYEVRAVITAGSQYVSMSAIARYSPSTVITISGKTASRYQRTYRIPLTGPGPWDIRVRRISPISTTQALRNALWWDVLTVGIDAKLSYPNSAVTQLQIDAEQFNSIPTRGYEIFGMLVKVPTNYNPATRAYSGTWDGSFKLAWTDNPAWCFYDIATVPRYGLGAFIRPEQIDKWALYSIGRYCDELVPDGYGGMEPRFTCNLYLQTREEAFKVLASMASIFRAMAFWADSMLMLNQDSPQQPVMSFVRGNVINGEFTYQGSDVRVRHTVALVSWNDPADMYRQKIEYVSDDEAIARYGVVQTEILAVGCTSRGQAHRLGKWLIYTEQSETETVTFQAGLDSARLMPGSIIETQDPMRAGKRMGGRIVEASLEHIRVDAPVTIEAGQDYQLSIMLPDGKLATRNVVNAPGDTLEVHFTPELPELPVESAVWVLSATELKTELWRVVSLAEGSEDEQLTVRVTAVAYNPEKFAAVEQGLVLEPRPTSALEARPKAPVGFASIENHYPLTTGDPGFRLTVSWDSGAPRYKVRWRTGEGDWTETETVSASVTIDGVSARTYEFRVRAVNGLGRVSDESIYTVEVRARLPLIPPPPGLSLAVTGGDSLQLRWGSAASPYPVEYEVRASDEGWGEGGEIYRGSGLATPVPPAPAGTPTVCYVRTRDLQGQYSASAEQVSFTVAAPLAPAISGRYVETQFLLSWNDCTATFLLDHYELRAGASWESSIPVGVLYANQRAVDVNWSDSQTFWVRATDMRGNHGPATSLTTVLAKPGATPIVSQFKDARLILSWAAAVPGSLPIRGYEVREGSSWASGQLVGRTTDQLYSLPVNWTSEKAFWVAAIDALGNYGAASTRVVTYEVPGSPSALSLALNQANISLSWLPGAATSLPIAHYRVRYGASWAAGMDVGTADTTTMTLPVNWLGSRNFWVAAIDSNGGESAPVSGSITVNAPGALTLASQIVVAKAELSWGVPSASLPIKEYEIRYGESFAEGTPVATTPANNYRVPITWLGTRTFWVAARDVNGNLGVPSSSQVVVNAPAAPALSGEFVLDQFKLEWTTPASSLPLDEYEVRYGDSWASGTVLGTVKGTTISTKAQWSGQRKWFVAARDVNGNVGTPAEQSFGITAPSQPQVTKQVLDNNVLLYWSQAEGTLPVETYEVRRGATWETAVSVGQKSGGFTTVFETVAGSYTYWVAGIDSAGNVGTPGWVTAFVQQPPDYRLLADENLDLDAVTHVNTKKDLALGGYLLPVNRTETFAQHFASRGWADPADQVAAGFPVFIQPTPNGHIEHVIDYGTVLGGTKITVTPSGQVMAGVPETAISISVRKEASDPWIDFDSDSVFANQFRYVKVRFEVTSPDGRALYRLNSLNVKLDVKLRNDAGRGTASASDSVSGTTATINGVATAGANADNEFGNRVPDGDGTLVRFNEKFIDITSLEVSVAVGSDARYGLYDYLDVANPAGFKVVLFNAAGARVGGSFSWSAKGY